MTSFSSFHPCNSVNTLRLEYRPAFEVTVYSLPQEKVQELYNVLDAFSSGFQTHSNLESRNMRCRSTRSLSCPPACAGIVPLASSTTGSDGSQQSSGILRMQQPNTQEADRVRVARSLPTKPHPYNRKDSSRNPLGQKERPDNPQNMQVTPCAVPIRPLGQNAANTSLRDSDEDNEVLEDNDSIAFIDFLATLRESDPQRAWELERQYDVNLAELRHDEQHEAVFKDIVSR